MDLVEQRPGALAAIAFVVGLFIGLVVLGWWLWPVEYVGAGIGDLTDADKALILESAAELNAAGAVHADKVQRLLGGWNGATEACRLAQNSPNNQDLIQKLNALAATVNGQGCSGVDLTQSISADEGSSLSPLLFIALLAILGIAIWYVWNQRNQMVSDSSGSTTTYTDVPETAPVAGGESTEVAAVPIARFRTSYGRGHDTYDDSFSIENAKGDFLGECGVGISESIGTDSPKNVTAIEVWLFDKNDIRTITKVIMSDHAFFDDALKAKLAPKGEPVLARENETIVLETATLIINAEITEMDYGADNILPPQSYFDRFTIELSAWAKEGDFDEPDIQGRVDELMNY